MEILWRKAQRYDRLATSPHYDTADVLLYSSARSLRASNISRGIKMEWSIDAPLSGSLQRYTLLYRIHGLNSRLDRARERSASSLCNQRLPSTLNICEQNLDNRIRKIKHTTRTLSKLLPLSHRLPPPRPPIYIASSTSSGTAGSVITFSINCSVALNGNPTTLSNVPSIFSTNTLPTP